MKGIQLESLQIHTDIRVHPARPSGRTFFTENGYELEWFPPHLFRARIRQRPADPGGEDNPTHERWFAVTNCESWQVRAGEVVEIPEQTTAKMLLTGIVEISKQLAGIRDLLTAKPAASQAKSK